jgi:hypothetical protein
MRRNCSNIVIYPVKNTKCNVLYIFIFFSILTKRSIVKYTRHKIYILYQSHLPFCLYISLWITFVFVVFIKSFVVRNCRFFYTFENNILVTVKNWWFLTYGQVYIMKFKKKISINLLL